MSVSLRKNVNCLCKTNAFSRGFVGETPLRRANDHWGQADISILILGEAHKPQNERQFCISYELILSEVVFLTADCRGALSVKATTRAVKRAINK